jgi:hypothetical protein
MIKFTKEVEDKFWNKVNVPVKDGVPDLDACMMWKGGLKGKSGYGQFLGKYAHRVSYEMYYKTIDSNLDVLHSCDNPSCINPRHLRQGTHQDNMDDMIQKGRAVHPTGGGHPSSSLDDSNVEHMLIEVNAGKFSNIEEVAETYNTSVHVVRKILSGISYRNVTKRLTIPLSDIKAKVVRISSSNNRTEQILIAIQNGEYSSVKEIVTAFAISSSTVYDILDGVQRWKHITDKFPLKDIKAKIVRPNHKGSNAARSKLNQDQVNNIREQLKLGTTCASLGRKYGVSTQSISRIKNNQSW